MFVALVFAVYQAVGFADTYLMCETSVLLSKYTLQVQVRDKCHKFISGGELQDRRYSGI